MKLDRLTFIKILLLTLAILVESPTIAQADIIATPKTVTINAVKGESITRTISLRFSYRRRFAIDYMRVNQHLDLMAGVIIFRC